MSPDKVIKYVIAGIAASILLPLLFGSIFLALSQLHEQTSAYPEAQKVIEQGIQAEKNMQTGIDLAGVIEDNWLVISSIAGIAVIIIGYLVHENRNAQPLV